ncbi:DUF2318 domain-containing protein [Pseudodesulfovibrio portus]|uniref:Membrane protein n=1 Tax=Pseudodesulfovibrio portus TaxID=231439 RepID=A0ABM8AR90_9BACT|nr:DUF2318 domain-containing protein [Pseudodesulfovibrio portus]BDQ33948.1 membrane protein [Pseudodesulfovibrio portus]
MKKVGIHIGLAVLLVVGVAVNGQAFWGFGQYDRVEPVNGVVTIPVGDVSDGRAHYFSYDHDGREVKFFLLKSSDGVIRAAFDACDVCFGEKKGYSQDGDFMICNNCGQRFHSARINVVKGGCNPSPLDRAVEGNDVVLKARDIAAGSRYF